MAVALGDPMLSVKTEHVGSGEFRQERHLHVDYAAIENAECGGRGGGTAADYIHDALVASSIGLGEAEHGTFDKEGSLRGCEEVSDRGQPILMEVSNGEVGIGPE